MAESSISYMSCRIWAPGSCQGSSAPPATSGAVAAIVVRSRVPVSGNDVQYLASLNLARMNRDGAEAARLVQVDPEYTFRSADRGKPMLSAFEPAAWLLDGARTVWPVSASYCTADVAMPVIRYLVDPVKAPLVSVERV